MANVSRIRRGTAGTRHARCAAAQRKRRSLAVGEAASLSLDRSTLPGAPGARLRLRCEVHGSAGEGEGRVALATPGRAAEPGACGIAAASPVGAAPACAAAASAGAARAAGARVAAASASLAAGAAAVRAELAPERPAQASVAATARIAAAPAPGRRRSAKRPARAARARQRPGRAARGAPRRGRRSRAAQAGGAQARSRRSGAALQAARAAGEALAQQLRAAPDGAPAGWQLRQALNAAFSRTRQAGRLTLQAALQEGAALRDGFAHSWGQSVPPYVLLPLRGSAAAVVTVRNEEAAIRQVLRELALLPLDDTIVVINGSSDHSFKYAREFEGVTIVHEPSALGLDVGRALGAKMTDADIVLFMDGDFPVPAPELAAFLYAVDQGVDVALNDVMPYLSSFAHWDAVSRVKQFLNSALGREDLGANSLTCIPHALSRKAIQTIGVQTLAVPPKAQAAALNARLTAVAVASINVFAKNRRRKQNTGADNPVARLILGDHIEALHSLQYSGGSRLAYADRIRRRNLAGG